MPCQLLVFRGTKSRVGVQTLHKCRDLHNWAVLTLSNFGLSNMDGCPFYHWWDGWTSACTRNSSLDILMQLYFWFWVNSDNQGGWPVRLGRLSTTIFFTIHIIDFLMVYQLFYFQNIWPLYARSSVEILKIDEDALFLNITETLSSTVNTFHMSAIFFK